MPFQRRAVAGHILLLSTLERRRGLEKRSKSKDFGKTKRDLVPPANYN